MSIKKLIDLANGDIPVKPMNLGQIKEWQIRMEQFDQECTQRQRNRIPTQEQLNKVIDWGIRNG